MILAHILTPLENLLEWVLTTLHESVGLPWAWAIVATTIIVRILLVPLTVRQIHSMQNLQAHMPEMKAIQQKYKGDRQRQNEELMKFYKENSINPAASCLPILAQIPVFIGLFFVLRDAEKEIFQTTTDSLEWLNLVNIVENTRVGWGPLLVVIYVISQLTSSYFMSTTMQGAQRVMLMVLPIVFVPFVLNFPAGLMLYWVTTNLWTTGQGLVTRRMIPKTATAPPKRSSRTPPKEKAPAPAAEGAETPAEPKPAASTPAQVRRVKRKKKAQRR